MQKAALTSALAVSIVAFSAAAEPIQMADKELETIHAGEVPLTTMSVTSRPDGSLVIIKNGVEYLVTDRSLSLLQGTQTFSLPDGTKVQIIQNNGHFTILTTMPVNISESVSGLSGKR